MMTQWDSMKRMYWSNGATMRARRIRGERKANRMELEVIKAINRRVGELAKANAKETPVLKEPNYCAKWQWDLMMEQETDD